MTRTIFASFTIAVCVVASASAQNSDLYKSLKEKFPDDPAVFVTREETVTLQLKEDSLLVFSDVSEDILHLKEQSEVYSSGRVYGSHFNQVKDIKAKTLVWDRSRYKEMNVSDFKKNSDRDAGVFYDDSYYYSFNYPSVSNGNRTQLQYRSTLKDVKFLPGFIFSTYLPQGKTAYVIKTSPQVDLFYEVLNDAAGLIKFRKYDKGGFRYYEWTATNLPARRSEDSSPSVRYYAPHLVTYVKSYETKKGKVNVLGNLDDLYHWYYSFVKDLNADTSPELVAVVEKIKAQSKTEKDVVRGVFYWVQDNIQYIAFEEGMRGLIPHHANYVCDKRYGDCKDMANLIVNMLHLAGVKAYHTWIGTRDLPYKYTQVPTPLVDNHMIATYVAADGQYYFLDATSDHTPFGLPSSMIQGKEALVGIDKDHYEVKVVPEIAKEKNLTSDSVSIKLDGNQIVGTGKSALQGYAKVFGGYELDRAEKDDVRRYVTRLVGKGSNKFYLDDYSVTNQNDRERPTRVGYKFRIGDYFQKISDELYINLNLNKDYYNAFINVALRQTPKENDYKYEKLEFCELAIPADYEVEYLPPNAKLDGDLVGFEARYEKQPGKILFTKTFYINYLLLQPAQFERWNEAIKTLSEAYKESIILKKKL
ncbi:transglutaminase-like domain-containing protein [Chryseolinea lacunae]|uniref:Transglutaminase domain-containing protein n=1 Tax=Chryseolinea lacunae TaxID=2801331 RepID=A0ABS1KSR9_9BACT|nr:transglutaminase domain-containing protein [Chryseolinea lacunae]MBL0742518.1 transglutaminase domain-containing protein [Chryseolinea lacunae]